MTIYLQATLEIRAEGVAKFEQTMEKIIPIVEGAGWKLIGAYVQRTGRLHTVIDLWRLDDYNHYDRALKVLGAHPSFSSIAAALAETIEKETVVFLDKVSYSP